MNSPESSCAEINSFSVFRCWFSSSLLLPFFLLLVYAGSAFAINVNPQSLSVAAGSSATVSVEEARGTVTVSTSSSAIAQVSYATGVATITGVSPGRARITITARGDDKRVSVTVTSGVTPGLTVTPAALTIPIGGDATVSVAGATGSVTATSSNTAVASVSYAAGSATVHGVAAGAASVTIADGVSSRTVAVTVSPGLNVSPAAVQVPVGAAVAVSVTSPAGTVTASSANPAVATVTYAPGRATIQGVSAGSTTVTVADGFSSRTVLVSVTAALAVSPASVEVAAGSNVSVSVANATGAVTVSTSNSGIATVTYLAGTATIHGVAAGPATITVADIYGTRQVVVNVIASSALAVTPSSVIVPVGGSSTVSVTNANGAVTASSSNTSIATVSYNSGTATIQGVSTGDATITVRDSQTTRTVGVTVIAAVAGNYTLLAWNNLGMHCFDGVDYSMFTILPPLNTLLAQLKNKSGALVTGGVTITYEATTDTRGSINSSSANKTNFWQYVQKIFGAALPPDMGLLGYPTASTVPAAMSFNAERKWFEAPGIPITNYDDNHARNEYPMVRVVARNTTGQILATTSVVLPVSDELECSTCHTSNTGSNAAANAARPATGWEFYNDANDPMASLKDWKLNILRLHDEKQAGNAVFTSALQKAGYPNGLYNSASGGNPVLCASCHVSNAYQIDAGVATGISGISSLTGALHTLHGTQIDPASGLALDDITNRTSCYQCHPGSTTQCLRGAMSGPEVQCQSCHGNMAKVGEPSRAGWLDEPTCEACHNNGQRLTSAVDGNGNPLVPADHRFATTANQPSTGYNLYRFSEGHGGVQCQACHGATHAEYPSIEANDNVQSIALQGHAGTVNECTACHQTVPRTANGGPHGMHSIDSRWVSDHHDLIGAGGGASACAYCHGSDFRGSPLATVKTAKSFSHDGRTVSYAAGQQVSCYDCHNGPRSSALTGSTKLASGSSSLVPASALTTRSFVPGNDNVLALNGEPRPGRLGVFAASYLRSAAR